MKGINIYGLIITIIIMIPNIIFAVKVKNIECKYKNKIIEIIEQIGRFGSLGLMIFDIPILNYGYWFSNCKTLYIILSFVLAFAYCFSWVLYFKKPSLKITMALAIIPTILFLSSGILLGQVLLIIVSILFGIGHITITYNNNK